MFVFVFAAIATEHSFRWDRIDARITWIIHRKIQAVKIFYATVVREITNTVGEDVPIYHRLYVVGQFVEIITFKHYRFRFRFNILQNIVLCI